MAKVIGMENSPFIFCELLKFFLEAFGHGSIENIQFVSDGQIVIVLESFVSQKQKCLRLKMSQKGLF